MNESIQFVQLFKRIYDCPDRVTVSDDLKCAVY